MNTVSKRLEHALKLRGWSQAETARAASSRQQTVSQQALNQIITRDSVTSKFLPAIARALRVRLEWLTAGVEPMEDQSGQVRLVPLISSVQAGSWTGNVDTHAMGGDVERIACDSPISEAAFALKIAGPSMEPRFIDGDVIIVDPLAAPIPGDFVVAKRTGTDDTTFKKYRQKTPQEIELVALNPDYETLTISGRNRGAIIGPMIEHHSYRRQR